MNKPITLAIGHITHDRVNGELLPGGCAYYASGCWRALGTETRLATALGEDFACDGALAGMELLARRKGRTTVFRNFYPEGAPRVQFVEAEAERVLPVELPENWRRADVMFLGPVIDEVDAGAWMAAVDARIVAVGVQGFVREAVDISPEHTTSRRVMPKRWYPEPQFLAGVDVACLSEEDLIGQEGLLNLLCAHVPLVALTKERKGCDLLQEGGSTWVGIHPAKVVDPTGAGDGFAAGFLFGLAREMDPVDAARLGAACASIVIEGRAGEAFGRIGEAYERARIVPP
ncbi:MAG: sugar kinase [Deltaproteobacteria bacterium]|nr:sugar kinase [Deltaproteobacteria bacterium]